MLYGIGMGHAKMMQCIDCSWSANSSTDSCQQVDQLAIEHHCATAHSIVNGQNPNYECQMND